MSKSLRLLAVAAVLCFIPGAGSAAAQTLIVRKAPVGSPIELFVNSTKAGSAQADAAGDVKIPFELSTDKSRTEIDARVYVDICDAVRRVHVVERDNVAQPPESGCARQEIIGVFLVRRVTNLVIDVGTPVATLLLRQGSYSLRPPTARRPLPKGLILFGGGGLLKYSNAIDFGCEGVSQCSGEDTGAAVTAGLDFWFSRFIAVEGSYIKPPELTIAGSGDTFRFNSSLKPQVVTIAGKVGIPAGPIRLYARAGANYTRAKLATTQTNDAVTVDIGGFVTTTPASTSTVTATTSGWGWIAGGGMEAWLAPAFALYAEGSAGGLKGKASDQNQIDNRVLMANFGIRVHLGK